MSKQFFRRAQREYGSGKSRRRRRARSGTSCVACGNPLTTNRASDACKPCDLRREAAAVRCASKPTPPVRYIAGYVPRRGSVAYAVLYQVIDPIRGMGL